MLTIAVLITVYNRKEKTIRCLSNLFSQVNNDQYKLNVYLVDDGSTDSTSEEIAKLYPEVNLIKGDGTLFWNRGMHKAWETAAQDKEYDFYLWLNDDTNIFDDCIKRLLDLSTTNRDKAIIVGSTCATGNPDKITYGGWKNGILFTDLTQPNKCRTINGNIVLIPKSVYNILGMNDSTFRHCYGDTDYALRANEQGIVCLTGIGIFGECDAHEHPTIWMDPSQPFVKRWKNFFSPLGNNPFEFFYFRRKHFGLIAACATFVSNWLHFFFPWLWTKSYKIY